MLDERRALTLTYDGKGDILRVTFEHSRMHAHAKTFPSATKGKLLLDARGYLVGVDIGGDEALRSVVMLGKHEDVASTRETTIVITRVGSADGYELQIPNAQKQARGSERNPYLP